MRALWVFETISKNHAITEPTKSRENRSANFRRLPALIASKYGTIDIRQPIFSRFPRASAAVNHRFLIV
jgi:hypothetical protein